MEFQADQFIDDQPLILLSGRAQDFHDVPHAAAIVRPSQHVEKCPADRRNPEAPPLDVLERPPMDTGITGDLGFWILSSE